MSIRCDQIKRPWLWKGGPNEARKRYVESHPWYISYNKAQDICKPKGLYGIRGIKLLMSIDDFKFIWIRDKADLMKKPSIDRIDTLGNYTIENCRFIELSDNKKRKRNRISYRRINACTT